MAIYQERANSMFRTLGVPQKPTMVLRGLLAVAEAEAEAETCHHQPAMSCKGCSVWTGSRTRCGCCCESEMSSRKGMAAVEVDCGNLTIVSEIVD